MIPMNVGQVVSEKHRMKLNCEMDIYWATGSKLLSQIMERNRPKTAADQNRL